MHVVADTNTLISGLLKPQSIPDQALQYATGLGILVFSEETKDEFLDVLRRKKFDKYLGQTERLEKAMSLLAKAEVVRVNFNESLQCRDASDIKFLKLALQTKPAVLSAVMYTSLSCIRSGEFPYSFLRNF